MKARLCVVAGILAIAAGAAADPLEVTDAWVRQPPPGANAAAYLTLVNPGATTQRLVAASSDACERVEMHRSVVENGVARMRALQAIEVPAGQSVVLAPRGLHLMLIAPKPLQEGDRVVLRLALDGGETLAVDAPVRAGTPHGGHAKGHH